MYLVRNLYEGLLDLVFPPFCKTCGKRLNPFDRLICSSCWHTLQPAHLGNWKNELSYGENIDYVLTGWFLTDVLEKIIYGMKYHEERVLAEEIGGRLADMFKGVIRELNPDAIVPVPLHSSRRRERGFNQSDLIGKTVAQLLHVSYEARMVRRIKNTESQTGLSMDERRRNMAGAFLARDSLVPRRVLIIDDVLTSGATLSECANALREGGAKFIAVLAAATPPVQILEREKRERRDGAGR